MENKIGIIGGGNLATAFINGLSNHHVSGKLVTVYDLDSMKVASLVGKYNIVGASTLEEIVSEAKLLILAVKPQGFPTLINELKEIVTDEHIIVSVAAGLKIDKIYEMFDRKVKLIRTMPNTPASVNEGITGVVVGETVSQDDKRFFENVFEHLGMIAYIKEEQFDAFTAICGSSPAFIYMFMNGMIKGGIEEGLDPDIVGKMVAQAVLGAAKMVKESDEDPDKLRERVTSKAGVTWKGVEFLQNANFEKIVSDCIVKTTERSIELNKELE